ncbi:MAG: ubiquinol-cytochrome c reductase cytochrome c subunit [Gaiellaceae bacterium]|jgi:ubiquinol-cytochrome c reductase cytochrome c subunit|nr:ubiquinol-cytochrome c reductase cytochrome c subunit [Gaiellaceae bacterium]
MTGDPQRGRDLYLTGCQSCHGVDARGIHGTAPSLHGVGAASADFYLSTGRMPLDDPRSQPDRTEPAYDRKSLDDLIAYIGSLGGPAVPEVDVGGRVNLAEGQKLFTANCAACHQIAGRGGVISGAFVPTLLEATPRQVVEAARIGPYVMPRFSEAQLNDRELVSIARYVQYAKHPENPGGWALFNVGPVPEGMVTWLIGLLALLLVIRMLGRNEAP